MAAPKAPSELGQSWAGLITAAVLLFVPPPQDGALLARYITARYVLYRPTYIPGPLVRSPLYGSTIFFSPHEKFPPVWIESPPGSFATATSLYCHFKLLPTHPPPPPPPPSSPFSMFPLALEERSEAIHAAELFFLPESSGGSWDLYVFGDSPFGQVCGRTVSDF